MTVNKILLQEAGLPKRVVDKREVEIIILEEGPGNRQRKCWYGPEALESGVAIFRGAQVFANHPTKTQQVDLPERDVRELVGRIKETYLARNPKNGKLQLRGVLKILEGPQYDWTLSLIHESIQAKNEGFPPVAQVSIHADGDVEKQVIEGEQYNYVKNIKSAVSVDIVTKGGISNAGFVKFIESYYGGKKQMDKVEERLAQIQHKIASALNSEDTKFLESLEEQELAEGDDDDGDMEYEQVFVDDDGSLVSENGEVVDPSEVFGVDEEENVYSPEELQTAAAELLDEDDIANEYGESYNEDEDEDSDYNDYNDYGDDVAYDDNEVIDEEELPTEDEIAALQAASDDEVPISELATKYPQIADEIDQEEFGMEESNRDIDIVNLKFENKLLKSRLIAEQKILESGLPAGFISIRELIGHTPEDMDQIIQDRQMLLENFYNIAESVRPATIPADYSRQQELREAGAGRRILDFAVTPTY